MEKENVSLGLGRKQKVKLLLFWREGRKMSLNALDNCPRCGKLFVRGARSVCPDCYREVEEEFKRVYEYVRKSENRQRNIYEVSEATNVTVKQITEFIRAGRLSTADFPHLAYPCESCGENLITEGRICESCRQKLSAEIRKSFAEVEEEERRRRNGTGFYLLEEKLKTLESKKKK